MKACVPGNYELDLLRAGQIKDPFVGDRVLDLQNFENRHPWYCRTFQIEVDPEKEYMLCFDGIDTIAEIYLNGQYIGRADNMLIPHTYDAVLQNGENELVVHIIPAMIEARKYPVGVGTITHLTYNADSLHLLANVPDTLEDFALASQITQAEALKYFIESYRCTKWERTGIIWWNLVDGWPQFSDSVVDYYFTKKLAYHTVKTSQQAVRLMLRNEENRLVLMGANEHL